MTVLLGGKHQLASPFRSSLHASNELTSDATISFQRALYLLLRLLII
jgi:hypothetical protein